ncbi:inner membrane-spanning protein YciB [Zymobacter palmae]|uniref:Inner membrane-spanning protein YciB n=1 Tax=Zymobacter palmae TaxID=33074 RepID=A0A348HFW3_9GAMM|nr:inner membrane-spanning protein YciB [Zymobacter palmae]BBG30515.1 intracellular septation protein A [Zymobacter palmae]
MNNLLNFLPVAIFFGVYKYYGDLKIATAVLMVATVIHVLGLWLYSRAIKPIHLVTLVLVLGFGAATLLLNDHFIVWKPTVLNLVMALAFLLSPLFGKRQPLVQMMMGKEISLPSTVWHRLNIAWVVFFVALAIVNLLVYRFYGESVWVTFKLFGMLGLTVLFVLAQGIWLARQGALAHKTQDDNDGQ